MPWLTRWQPDGTRSAAEKWPLAGRTLADVRPWRRQENRTSSLPDGRPVTLPESLTRWPCQRGGFSLIMGERRRPFRGVLSALSPLPPPPREVPLPPPWLPPPPLLPLPP